MNKLLPTIAVLFVLGAASMSYADNATTKDQFIGTWKVVELKTTSDGKVSHPLGERPDGYVTLTENRIWLLFVDAKRKAPAARTLTDAEAIAMMKSQVAWTGGYTTETSPGGPKITAHVDTASSQAITGNDRVYLMRVEGDKLTMKSPGVIVPMTGALSIVEIELTRAE